MDTRLNYRDIIKKILQEHAEYRASLGVPKGDIVLGFRYPKIREYTGFAVA